MRLDAVASAGMGMSRGKLKDMIEGGDVLVNWKEVRVRVDVCRGGWVGVGGKGGGGGERVD
jgi:RNA-binding protein YlmH